MLVFIFPEALFLEEEREEPIILDLQVIYALRIWYVHGATDFDV